MYMCVYTSAGSLSLLLTKLWDHHCSFQTISITSKRKKPHAPLFPPPPQVPSTLTRGFSTALLALQCFQTLVLPNLPPPPPGQRTPLIQALPGCSNTWNGGGGGRGDCCVGRVGGGAARDTRSTLNPLPFASLPSGVS